MRAELIGSEQLSSVLSITLEPSDYAGDYEKRLKRYRDNAQLKGFRKGKAPMSLVKKLYAETILGEVLSERMQKSLSDYIQENELNILGEPILNEPEEPQSLSTDVLKDYHFSFELGIVPDFELQGVSSADVYTGYNVVLSEAYLKEKLEDLRKQYGQRIDVEGAMEDDDLLSLIIEEKNPVDPEKCFTNEIKLLVKDVSTEYSEQIKKLSVKDKIDIDIYKLEKSTSEDFVKKYFLTDASEDVTSNFTAEIQFIRRLVPAELDADFFKQVFNSDTIADEAGALEEIKLNHEASYARTCEAITGREVMEAVVEKNNIAFPESFLKKYIIYTNKDVNPEDVDKDYPAMERNLRWSAIKRKITETHNIEISREEVKEQMAQDFIAQLRSWGYNSFGDLNIEDIVERSMQDRDKLEQTYEKIRSQRVVDYIVSVVTIDKKNITLEELESVLDKYRENNAA